MTKGYSSEWIQTRTANIETRISFTDKLKESGIEKGYEYSAELATKKLIPELLIDKLFDQFEKENDIIKIAKESLEKKKNNAEKLEVEQGEKPILLTKIKSFAQTLRDVEPKRTNNPEKLNAILREFSFDLKNEFYR